MVLNTGWQLTQHDVRQLSVACGCTVRGVHVPFVLPEDLVMCLEEYQERRRCRMKEGGRQSQPVVPPVRCLSNVLSSSLLLPCLMTTGRGCVPQQVGEARSEEESAACKKGGRAIEHSTCRIKRGRWEPKAPRGSSRPMPSLERNVHRKSVASHGSQGMDGRVGQPRGISPQFDCGLPLINRHICRLS